jgi:NitT/TauT family transport system substrate-binding protein
MRRRRFLQSVSVLGAAATFGWRSDIRAEPSPETDRIRLVRAPGICIAPQYIAEDFLRMEGFRQIEYVEVQQNNAATVLIDGRADFSLDTVYSIVPLLDAGNDLKVLAGIHAGCYALVGNDRVEHIRDLVGKRIAISVTGGPDHTFIASILAYVGMKPQTQIRWIVSGSVPDSMRLFMAGDADAFLASAPQPQEIVRRNAGRVLVDSTHDRPWSQYFCCMAIATGQFSQKNPIATKRVLRAILKASDLCDREPELAAGIIADRGYEPRRAIGVEVLKSLPYDRWREANPEDTLRFYALRLHEVGMLRSSPENLIERCVDWRHLRELRRELKA